MMKHFPSTLKASIIRVQRNSYAVTIEDTIEDTTLSDAIKKGFISRVPAVCAAVTNGCISCASCVVVLSSSAVYLSIASEIL